MSIDLSESLDFLHTNQHEKVTAEALQVIVPILRLAERGVSFKEISKEVGITPEEVKNLVIRNRGWEAGDQQQRGHKSR